MKKNLQVALEYWEIIELRYMPRWAMRLGKAYCNDLAPAHIRIVAA